MQHVRLYSQSILVKWMFEYFPWIMQNRPDYGCLFSDYLYALLQYTWILEPQKNAKLKLHASYDYDENSFRVFGIVWIYWYEKERTDCTLHSAHTNIHQNRDICPYVHLCFIIIRLINVTSVLCWVAPFFRLLLLLFVALDHVLFAIDHKTKRP